jgi:hypothetical protein
MCWVLQYVKLCSQVERSVMEASSISVTLVGIYLLNYIVSHILNPFQLN